MIYNVLLKVETRPRHPVPACLYCFLKLYGLMVCTCLPVCKVCFWLPELWNIKYPSVSLSLGSSETHVSWWFMIRRPSTPCVMEWGLYLEVSVLSDVCWACFLWLDPILCFYVYTLWHLKSLYNYLTLYNCCTEALFWQLKLFDRGLEWRKEGFTAHKFRTVSKSYDSWKAGLSTLLSS